MSINNNLVHIISDSPSKEIAESINKILREGKNYGRNNYGKGKRINIEYTPFSKLDDFNIDSARTAIYGDCLSNIMSFAGYDVTREFYIEIGNKDIEIVKKELDNIRVNFDVFTEEQNLYDTGLIDTVLSKLQKSDKCYINDDSLWIKTTDFYDNKDRILIDGDGSYSYLLSEIAYHMDKFNRGQDKIIDIFNKKHRCIDGIKSGIEIVGGSSDKLDVIIIDDIKLINNNRDSNINKIVDEIGVNALRYYLTNIYDNEIDLDMAETYDIDNPIYYIENAYAKICKLLRGKTYKMMDEYSAIDSDNAYTILSKLIDFENVIIKASNGKVNIMCEYLYELASLYYNYEEEIVIKNSDYINEMTAILTAIRIVMNNTANMLGLILREEI